MKFITLTIIGLLASHATWAEPQPQRIAMSKPSDAEKIRTTAATQPKEMLPVNSSIVIRNSGINYSPVQAPYQPQNASKKAGLYKGQLVRAEKTRQTGEITGTILVKTSNQSALLQYSQARAIGKEFVLLSFGSDTELLAELKRLQERADVESAELEVNTKRHKPR